MPRKKTTKKPARKTKRQLPKVNGKSRAAGEKVETIEKKKTKVMKEQNVELIKALKNEVLSGQFSIGDLARQYNIPFQKARYLVHQIAKHEEKSVVRVSRGLWELI